MKRISKEELEALRNSNLFDEKCYLEQYPDVKMLGMDPLEHYVWVGKRLGRSPNKDDGGEARNSLFRIPNAPYAPLRRDIEHKAERRAAATTSQSDSLDDKSLGLISSFFDEEWYSLQFKGDAPDNPVKHFANMGWRLGLSPNRWFDTLGYNAAYPDVAAAGMNPFLHFLKSGRKEGRSPNPFFEDRSELHPDLDRPWGAEYGPISRVLKFHGDGIVERPTSSALSICVHVHLFYDDMAKDVLRMLSRIKQKFTLLVSVQHHANDTALRGFFEFHLPNASEVIVDKFPNRGRDVAPWLVHFKDKIREHDLFFHFHTKRSSHASEHKYWFRFLCHTMSGSCHILDQILCGFIDNPKLGLVAPGYWPELRRQPNFGAAEDQFRKLCARMGIKDSWADCPDFPAGSFFWCRVKMLEPLFELNLRLSDFPEEQGQVCGTIAHAVERVLGALPAHFGMTTELASVDVPHEEAEQLSPSLQFEEDDLVRASSLRVSVIIPTWNRRERIATSVRSVLSQTILPSEIIVIDDGSTDGSVEHINHVFYDEISQGLLKVIPNDHDGVSAARNSGLKASTGDIVAYLDSDNTWRPEYIAHILTAFEKFPNALAVYTDFLSHDADLERVTLYRTPYERSQLMDQNFIDLNVFSHRREVLDAGILFDLNLQRLVDWDFIIRITKARAPVHIQYVGVDYHLDQEALGNITRTVPLERNLEIVRTKHRKERIYWKLDPLNVVIKCPAPNSCVAHQWGDFHFAKSLCKSMEKLGFRTRIDFLEDWEKADDPTDDVVIVLRGLSKYSPKPGRINLLWLISHPDKTDVEELKLYDHVFVASFKHTRILMPALGAKVATLLQCTDVELFSNRDDVETPRELIFVGNSRGVDRWIPRVCVDRNLPIEVFGADWEGRLPDSVIKATHIENEKLGSYYQSAKIVLNDHWPSMAEGGFVSNRIFDAGLSGALVISDQFEGASMFGDGIVTCKDGEEVEKSVAYYLEHEDERLAKVKQMQAAVRMFHTFDHRAKSISRVIEKMVARRPVMAITTGAPLLTSDNVVVA